MNTWERGHKPKSLNAELYSVAQVWAASGRLPRDHDAWRLDERDEARHLVNLNAPDASPLPEFGPRFAEPKHERVVRGSCPCAAAWTGELACHCGTCHLTFRSATGFDDHRTDGRCRKPAELTKRGYQPNESGHWRKPRPPETLPGQL